MNEQPTPETDELDGSLKNKCMPVLACYHQMKMHSRRLEIDRDEQRRILVMSGERECDLRDGLQRERALADRLAALLQRNRDLYGGQLIDSNCDCSDCEYLGPIDAAIAAWKEARSE